MKKITFLFIVFSLSHLSTSAQIKVTRLLCENRVNPTGLDNAKPRLSWIMEAAQRNSMQSAYEVRVATDTAALQKGNSIWNTGKISSGQSVYISYAGTPLQSGQKYYWQVRVWDNSGNASAWSPTAQWQMGLLQPSDWKAKWIGIGYEEDSVLRPSPLLRKQFTAAKKIKSAVAFITAHGMYEAFINGKRVGDLYLTPGWTSYNKRLQYQTYDVTGLMAEGANAIGVMLGSGWYRGSLAWEANKNLYGRNLGLLLQLNITYADGTSAMVVSDETWKSTTGEITYSEIYHGETQDARKEKQGWATAQYSDAGWSGVRLKESTGENIIATENEPVKKQEKFKALKILTTPEGDKVIDFGQNLVGWVVVKAKGNAGDKIMVSHAEVLDKKGNFYTENLRSAKQQNTYVLKGGTEETFEPHFTWQGFRYVKVQGIKGELRPENFTAVAIYSDMPRTGTFATSNALLNQLQHNIEWGQKGNFIDVPTDCPQRDERLGWTGDAQAFARTAAYNMNVHSFFAKWMKDLAADQLPNGAVPYVIPNVLGSGAAGSAGWADAATIIPWNLYLAYGDKKLLEDQYPSMKAWVGYMQKSSADYLWNKGFHFGDWLFYRPGDDLDGRSAVTDKYLIAQCFFANSVQLLINTATTLGKNEDVQVYTNLLKDVKAAFLKEYTTATGRMVSGTQTAYTLALNFDMLPEALRESAAKRLVENVASYNNHLTTGFLGTPYLCHVLTRFGYDSVAYKLLLQETYPSWLYPVKMGATTIWERWDGQKPDSTFQNPGMNSFNHYAYGAIGDWMYRVMAGINEGEPGYKKIIIKPHVGGGLTSAAAALQTYYGKVSSAWQVKGDQLQLEVEVPANTVATVFLPAKTGAKITEGGQPLSAVKGIKVIGQDGPYVKVETGSGKYLFTAGQ
ncbi:MAG TPA: glycoside hydrolase family 78 protein [Flavisolibacter sp.]|nr:glycoside hydrolase family 78 protein [Flavisolibacter sp.]